MMAIVTFQPAWRVIPLIAFVTPATFATFATLVTFACACDSPRLQRQSLQTQSPAPEAGAPAPPPAPEPTSHDPAPLAPLHADAPYIDLDVDGFGPAVVSLPLGTTEPRPIVLATHGNYDRPEWQCHVWRPIVEGGAFVLCPRGIARRDSPSRTDIRFTYANGKALEREIDAGLEALRSKFGAYIADVPIVYTGFSLGAIIGAGLAMRPKDATPYERLVLIEGGHDGWTEQTAKRFAGAGGKKVLFGCGQAGCFPSARKAAGQLERAGIATRIVGVKDAGHSYDGPVARAVDGTWKWLLESP